MATAVSAARIETMIEAPGPAGPLKGTMLAPPAGHGPVMLIIPGSGPTDRDGNSPAGVAAASYRLLAEGLVECGVTTVRVDKRGMFGSAAAVADANAVTIADYAADVDAWISVIRQQTKAACVWLLGHSEGGLVAMAAAKIQQDLCGLILVAAPGRPIGGVIRDQLKANPANLPILAQALSAIDALEAGRNFDTTDMNPALSPLFRPEVQRFLISAFSYDPARLLAGYQKPVLILQGQRDLQVHETDARILKAASSHATLRILPDVNHVLKSVTCNDVTRNIATYADANLPLAPSVVWAIRDFLEANAKSCITTE
jgi:pimeloyl-ACP methyl ester carboxylesterase